MKVHSKKIIIEQQNNGYSLDLELIKFTPDGLRKELTSTFVFTDPEKMIETIKKLLTDIELIDASEIIEEVMGDGDKNGQK